MHTPVLLLIHSRPNCTKRVFDAIRAVKPSRLYIAADGPRLNIDGESDRCQQTRKVVSQIDWNCDVRTLFRIENLGGPVAIPDAINWFFSFERQGIILEDDTLPNLSFFKFCEYLLEKYSENQKICHVTGNYFLGNQYQSKTDYVYSKYPYTWGWATWKHSWDKMGQDIYSMNSHDVLQRLSDTLHHSSEISFWHQKFMNGKNGKRHWDYTWHLSNLIEGGLTVAPTKNLISNIGFGRYASNCHDDKHWSANLQTQELCGELRSPSAMLADLRFDEQNAKKVFNLPITKSQIFRTEIQKKTASLKRIAKGHFFNC